MFLTEWMVVLVGMLLASWAAHSRPRRLLSHRSQREAVMVRWASLARQHGLHFDGAGSPPWTALAGRLAERPLRVVVVTGGGWGAEREFATQVTLTLRCPLDPTLALWKVGQPLRRRPRDCARVADFPIMASGAPASLRAVLPHIADAMAEHDTLAVVDGAVTLRSWGLPAALGDHIASLAQLAAVIEEAVCAPWVAAAEALGLSWAIEDDCHLLLTGGGLRVRVSPEQTVLSLERPVPGVQRIQRRAAGHAATPIGNPIADRFLLVEASPEVTARLRGAEATALAMEVLFEAQDGAVGPDGVSVTLPAGSAGVLGEWAARIRALAAALTKA